MNLIETTQALAWAGGGGHWWGWPFAWALWLVLIATVVWLVIRRARPPEALGLDRARGILAERYARGEISGDEYRERLEELR